MNYLNIKTELYKKKKAKEIKEIESIVFFDNLKLASMGSDDSEGYQIFTPNFIVRDMVSRIGLTNILDFSKTILEPTSGDGAFTTYILSLRLEKAYKENKDNFEINALKALSTIYSIEMDKELILKQRNNILTTFVLFAKNKKLTFSEGYLDIVKIITQSNFIWAMFNADEPISMLFINVAFEMPGAEEGKFKSLDFPVWSFNDSSIDFQMEGVEVEYD